MECSGEFLTKSKLLFCGQENEGTLTIKNDKLRDVNGIYLIIEGLCGVDVCDLPTLQQFFLTKIPLLQNGPITMEPGQHNFKFSFILDPELPSSVKHIHGKIIYTMKVEVEEKNEKTKLLKFEVEVIGTLDLNSQDPFFKLPLIAGTVKQFLFSSKTISINAEIPKQAFVVGENISVSVSVVNDTKVEIISMIISLVRQYKFRNDRGFVTETKEMENDAMIRSEQQGVRAKSKHQAIYTFQIPEMIFPSMQSKLIDASYKIEIIAKVRGIRISPRVYLPIIIGTIPFNE